MQKNLNDIIPPSRRRAMGEHVEAPRREAHEPAAARPEGVRPSYGRPERPRRTAGRKFPVVTALIALVVVLISVAALWIFSGAEVRAVAQESGAILDSGEFIAGAGSDLPFEVITAERVATASVPSEGTENVNQAAQGTITILNQQSEPQQLIRNTRFESPDGLVFRIQESVTVPAAQGGQPGSLSATVFADAAGDAYNIGPSTFTLPGLSGTELFTQVSARSDEAMRGGFAGPRPSVSDATRETNAAQLRASLEGDMGAALAEAVPEGYVLLKGASRVTYEPQPEEAGTGNTVVLAEKGIATGIVFPEEALAAAVARQALGGYTGQPVTFKDASGLTLTPVGDLPSAGATELAFSLTGSADILWLIDPVRIAGAVAGKTRTQATSLLSGYPEVDTAEIVLKPFWSSTFPKDPEDITVTVLNAPEAE